MERIQKTLDSNLDRAWLKFCHAKKGNELRIGLTKFLELNISGFISQLCKKNEIQEKDFYAYLLENL